MNLTIYDSRGQIVKTLVNGSIQASYQSIVLDGHNASGSLVSTGAYFCRIITDGFSQTRKMVLMK